MQPTRVAEILAGFPEVTVAYVFGSRATDRATEGSDLDLAIATTRGVDWPCLRAEVSMALRPLLGAVPLDLVHLNKAPIELSNAIISSGQRIFERSVYERVELEAWVMGRYGDYLPVLRAQRREIVQGCDRDARAQRYRAQARHA